MATNNIKKTTKTNFNTTKSQMMMFGGRLVCESELIHVDRYGNVYSSIEECVEANRA